MYQGSFRDGQLQHSASGRARHSVGPSVRLDRIYSLEGMYPQPEDKRSLNAIPSNFLKLNLSWGIRPNEISTPIESKIAKLLR